MINLRWNISLVMWDEKASLLINHIKLRETRIIELARVLTYDEDALQNVFDSKLSDRDLMVLMIEINRYLR